MSFKDSITDISLRIATLCTLLSAEDLIATSEKTQALITQMNEDNELVGYPSNGITDDFRAFTIAVRAMWLLLQRHNAKQPVSNIPECSKTILHEISDLLVRKNHDYGNSFGNQLAKHGPIVFVIRMEDKISRLKTLLTTDAQVKDESIEDTLRDIVGYCILFIHNISN